MRLEDCLNKGHIVANEKTKEWADKEIEIGNRFLKSANNLLNIGELEMSELAAYNAMFHLSRYLLFKKGYEEKSHICLYVAVQEMYKGTELVELFDDFHPIRERRNEIQYNGLLTPKEEVMYVIEIAEELSEWIVKNK